MNYAWQQYRSREPSEVLKDVEVGVRGQNKVSAMAKDLADKISADRKPPPPPAQEPRPVSARVYWARFNVPPNTIGRIGDDFYRSYDQISSVEALKETSWSCR